MSGYTVMRGVGSVILVPAVIAAAAVVALPSLAVPLSPWLLNLIVAAAAMVLLFGGAVALGVGTQRVALEDHAVRHEWLTGARELAVPRLARVDYVASRRSWGAAIVFVDRNGDRLPLNIFLWRHRKLSALVRDVRRLNPEVEIAPGVAAYLARVN